MKVAIFGLNESLIDELEWYLPRNCEEIVLCGVEKDKKHIKQYALERNLKYSEFSTDKKMYGKKAISVCEEQVIDYADEVVILLDHTLKGVYLIDCCERKGKKISIFAI